MADSDEERARLTGYVRATRARRRRLGQALGAVAAVAVGLAFVDARLGLGLFALAAIVGVIGFWIMFAHLTEWNDRIAKIDFERRRAAARERATPAAPRAT